MNASTRNGLLIGLVLIIGITVYSAAFILYEGRQAIITQFGKPIGQSVTDAGLHFKLPFIQDVRYVDKRILTWDGHPNQIPTKDKKYIIVDTTARWQIIDALKFIQTVQNERGAKARLDAILDAITRDTISNNNLVEAVRNTNQVLDVIAARRTEIERKKEAGEVLSDEEEVSGEIEKLNVGREQLSSRVAEKGDQELRQFGIKLIDVQIRRIAYEKSVETKVYERMISERKRIAEKIRSVGKGEQAKIQGKTSRDLQKINSQAYQKAQVIKGKSEAQATRIYARAFNQDKSFYKFLRTMEAYRKSLKEDSEFILSTDSKFLDFLRRR